MADYQVSPMNKVGNEFESHICLTKELKRAVINE